MKAQNRSKRAARNLLDRAMLPYSQQEVDVNATTTAEAAAETSLNSDFFHNVLHELRTLELERIPAKGGTFLSVGASGAWYFDWFERHVGKSREHIGVEAFEGTPDDLPDYVRWIESTADCFEGVDDNSVDLVFAGQTTEHLWAEELVGFLTESNRVLPDGGLLVADSPNRLVTERLRWTHGGHTIELSASEWTELLELGGFELLSARGAWLCDVDGRVFELEEGMQDPAMLTRRIALGSDSPDQSFVWWITAQRVSNVKSEQLRSRVDELFNQHFSTRVSRGMWPGPGADGPLVPVGTVGEICASLPMFLRSGMWRLSVSLDRGSWADLDGFRVDITSPGKHLIQRLDLTTGIIDGDTVTFEFERDVLIFALSIELHVDGVRSPVQVHMPIHIEGI